MSDESAIQLKTAIRALAEVRGYLDASYLRLSEAGDDPSRLGQAAALVSRAISVLGGETSPADADFELREEQRRAQLAVTLAHTVRSR